MSAQVDESRNVQDISNRQTAHISVQEHVLEKISHCGFFDICHTDVKAFERVIRYFGHKSQAEKGRVAFLQTLAVVA
jgi:hypothetical protein